MLTGVADVWSNFSFCSSFDTPNGWLFNQKRDLLIFFERCKNKQEINNTKFCTHVSYANKIG